MTERAAHLVDHVIPDVPVRQWVLTLPHRLRYLLAWRHDLCKIVVRVMLREVHRHLRTRARERGLRDVRGGAVAIVQRFGGALNLNVHIHALVLDGVFARGEDGRLRFHGARELDAADVADVLAAVTPGVQRLMARQDADDLGMSNAFAEASPCWRGWRPRPCRGGWRSAGRRAGARDAWGRRPWIAACPRSACARLRVAADGQVRLQLRHPWADGTTHRSFTPTAFLERLAVLVPRPRVNLVL